MYITGVLRASEKCSLVIEYLASNFLFSLAQWARALASKPKLAPPKYCKLVAAYGGDTVILGMCDIS